MSDSGPDEPATRVLVGPRTALAAELLDRDARAGRLGRNRLVVRDDRDRAALAGRADAGATLIDVASRGEDDLLGPGTGPVQLVVCALGPVHPPDHDDPLRSEADRSASARDLALVDAVLSAAGHRPVNVTLVSSVIALAPQADRHYYGGWKNLVEAELSALVERQKSTTGTTRTIGLTVLYPGRLASGESHSPMKKILNTPYPRLARLVESVSEGAGSSRTVGFDSRIWLAAQAARLLLRSLRGR